MATCAACNSEVASGSRWCSLCHAYLPDPSLGHLAAPAKRFVAYVLDIGIPLFACVLIFMTAGVSGGLGGAAAGDRAGIGLSVLVGLVLLIGYAVWAVRLFSQGTTPGKNLLSMRVVKEDGHPAGFVTMLFRETIGKLISSMVLSLGYLWILIDKDRQAWHDKFASTYVIG